MRLSNRSKVPYYNFVLTLINVLLIVGLLAFILEKTKLAMFGNESILFILIPIILLVIFLIRGKQIFEYDSDGEALHFKNRNIIPFLSKEARDEFPKYKLVSYEVVNGILFKNLYVRIKSKKEHIAVLKYDVSYLSNREIKDLKTSLGKIVRTNRQAEKEEGNTQS